MQTRAVKPFFGLLILWLAFTDAVNEVLPLQRHILITLLGTHFCLKKKLITVSYTKNVKLKS